MKRRDFLKSTDAANGGMPTGIQKSASQRNFDPLPAGKLWRIVRAGRGAVLLSLLLGLSLAGWIPTARAQSMGRAPVAPAAGPGQNDLWLRIIAFTDAPIVGADVSVSEQNSQGRPLLDVHAATNNYGVFPAAVPSHLKSFRVTISGGRTSGNRFLGHLSADVAITDPAHQIVAVNPVTTLVSLVMDARPNLKLDDAETRVRTFLTLPVKYPLGLVLRQSSRYRSRFFSPFTLLTEAQAAGGLDAFEHLLLQELLASDTHSFRQPKLLGDTSSTATSDVQAGLEAGILDYAGANNVANLAGWTMGLAGLGSGASSDDIDAVLNALVELQSEIEDLSYQVAQLTQLVQSTATQTEYNTIVVPAQSLAVQVNGVESDLTYFANACPPLPAGSTPIPPDTFCTNQKLSVNAELNSVTIQQAYVTMESYVGDNTSIGFRGMLHLYSLWLAQTRPAFWRAAESTQMQNLYNYWDAALTQAANLKVELLHENGAQDNQGGQKQLTDFMGNPDLNPPTTGTFQANQAANLNTRGRLVPDGTVVSTVNGTMWALIPWGPGDCFDCAQGANQVPVTPLAICWAWNLSGSNQKIALPPTLWGLYSYPNDTLYGIPNWNPLQPPLMADWQAAVKNAPPGTDWQQWLIDQTKTTGDESPTSDGFFNGNSCPSASWAYNNQYASSDQRAWEAIFPNKQSTFIANTQWTDQNLLWPVHYAATGEFYLWTN